MDGADDEHAASMTADRTAGSTEYAMDRIMGTRLRPTRERSGWPFVLPPGLPSPDPTPERTITEQQRIWSDPGAEQVAPDVHRIPLPLPGDGLKAVNVYAIAEPEGVTLIDAGWALGQARTDLEAGLNAADHDLGDVRQVLVTHAHRDHLELAFQLRRDFGTRIRLGIGERVPMEDLVNPPPRDPSETPMAMRLRRAGADEVLDRLRTGATGDHAPLDLAMPDEWIEDGIRVELASRTLTAIATPGHTRGHVVFLDEASGVLFSGDHILPHITPSIGFEQVPADSPLSDYLASLALVRALPDTRMLPAHGPVQPTTHGRIDELLAHHEVRLAASGEAVAAGAGTATEVAQRLPWTRRDTPFADLDAFNAMLAINETMAHLDVLVERGGLAVTDDDGVNRYVGA